MSISTDTLKANVNTAASLKDLRDALNELRDAIDCDDAHHSDHVDLCALQTFGGTDIIHTENVWSWDAANVMYYGDDGYYVEARSDI